MINLKARSIEAGVSGTFLATTFNVTPAAVSKWLNRKTPVPHQHMAKFAAMIGVTVEDLLPRSECESGCSGKQEVPCNRSHLTNHSLKRNKDRSSGRSTEEMK